MPDYTNDPRLLATIGWQHAGFKFVRFLGSENLDEVHAAVWQIGSLQSELQTVGFAPGARLTPAEADRIGNSIEWGHQRLFEWVAKGNTLAIILDAPPAFQYQDMAGQAQLFHALPEEFLAPDEWRISDGSHVQAIRIGKDESPLIAWSSSLCYLLILTGEEGTPLLEVKTAKGGQRHAVGLIKKIRDGHLILAPPLANQTSLNIAAYFRALVFLPETLASRSDDLASWADQFCTAEEAQIRDRIDALRCQIEGLIAERDGQLNVANKFRTAKYLFGGSGESFLDAVAQALEALGFGVVRGPESYADLLALDGNTILAIEAKGLEGSARAFNLGQTRRWTADVAAALESDPEALTRDRVLGHYASKLNDLGVDLTGTDYKVKGMLVIGTYCKQPLPERSGVDYPDPVVRACQRSNICALTGLQLLGLWLDVECDAALKPKFRAALLSCDGQYAARDWRDFLQTMVAASPPMP